MYDSSAVLEAAQRAIRSGSVEITGFLDPEEQDEATRALAPVGEAAARLYGGYRGARRKRLAIMPASFVDEAYDPGISFFALRSPSLRADAVLGADPEAAIAALRAMGIGRDDIGDVFAASGEWQGAIVRSVFGGDVAAGVAQGVGVAQPLDRRAVLAGDGLVELDAAEVSFPGQASRSIRATVASLRLDAVAGAGFGASRTRLAQEIKVGRFTINGDRVDSPSAKVSPGDVIVCRGRGRLVVEESPGATKKGRISVVLTRYSMHTANM